MGDSLHYTSDIKCQHINIDDINDIQIDKYDNNYDDGGKVLSKNVGMQ